jgi:hypothetical protein
LLVDVLPLRDVVLLVVIAFSRTNLHFDLQRNVVQLLRVSDLQNANSVRQCAQLLVSDLHCLWVAVLQVEPVEHFATLILAVKYHVSP